MNLQSTRGTAAAIAWQAGAELLRRYAQPHTETTKSSAADIVTEADTPADAVIVAALQAAFPGDHIVTEESGGVGAPASGAARTWYVDPLDGTSNFAAGFPFFCVSMGLADRDGNPLVGVVYDPVRGELFTAARGLGAALNGQPLRVSAAAPRPGVHRLPLRLRR
ncbi:MAG: inositol monophosphatase family protein [Aggregatilineales bacterium]